jgi:hypothetical protein
MTYSRVLALVLCCFTASHSYSDTTGDILNPATISGSYEPCSGSDCWGGTSGGSNPSWNGGTARWGYGAGVLAWNYALEQALANAGINIDGYNYSWRLKNGDANAPQGDGNDYMRISVRLYDAENNELWGKQYNLDGTYDWQYFNGQELFTSPLSGGDVSTVVIRAEGNDPGFWAGHYGPEFDTSASSVTLIYSNNPCYPDPLVDSTCPGYAEAYANKLLEEQMAAQQAAALETPSVETTTTPEQQTFSTPDPVQLGGTEVIGSSSGDPGSLSSQETTNKENDNKSKLALAQSLDGANNFDLSSVTGGATNPDEQLANDIISAAEAAAADTVANLTQSSIESSRQEEQQVSQQETAITQNSFEQIGGTSNEMGMESTQAQDTMGLDTIQTEVQSSLASTQVTRPVETRQERRERLKEITEKRANEISEENADADSMDEQTQQQTEQLALMNYVPGFDAYQTFLPGGVYPDVPFYKPTTVPESKRGLRNGLAQQLLHEQMIEMQYRREQ